MIVQPEPVRPDRLGNERPRRERGAVRPNPAGPPSPRPARQPGHRAADHRAPQPEAAEIARDGHVDRGSGGVISGDHDGAGRQARHHRQSRAPGQRAGREAAEQPGAGRVGQGVPRRAEMRLQDGRGGADRDADHGGGEQHRGNVAAPAEHGRGRRFLLRVRQRTGFTDTQQPIGSRPSGGPGRIFSLGRTRAGKPPASPRALERPVGRGPGGERGSTATVGPGP